jgi:hypothetical protein
MDRQKYYENKTNISGLCCRKIDRFMVIEDINKADSIRFIYNQIRIKEEALPTDNVPAGYKPMPYPKNYFCLKKYHFD